MVLTAGLAGKVITWIFFAIFGIRYTGGLYAWITENRLEQPPYRVLQRLPGGVELRAYEPYNVAETMLHSPTFKEATSNGFRLCAGYLFGKNVPRKHLGLLGQKPAGDMGEKMEMTAPVRQVLGNPRPKRTVKVSFVMSGKRKLRSLPVPRDAKVRLKEVPAHYAAFTRFSGPPPNDKVIEKKRDAVMQALKSADSDIRPVAGAETLVYGYHDPFLVPNLLRRNEVGVVVDSGAR